MLSRVFEQCGGVAIRYDNRLDEAMDFVKDEKFWKDQLADPADWYHFAFPCTNLTVARQRPTPSTRSKEHPYGDACIPDAAACNELVRLMAQRALALLSRVVLVTFENPLLSYGFLMDELLLLIGLPHFVAARSDHYRSGTPYQKAQVWTGNSEGLATCAAVCNHPQKHQFPIHLSLIHL